MEVSNCVVESFFWHGLYHKGLRSFLRSAIPFNFVRCSLFQARKRSEICWSCYKRTCSTWSRFGNSDNVGSINTTKNLSVEIKLKIILSTDAVFYHSHPIIRTSSIGENCSLQILWSRPCERRVQKKMKPRTDPWVDGKSSVAHASSEKT